MPETEPPTDTAPPEPPQAAPIAGALDDTHYRRAFAALCDDRLVRASTDIYTEDGLRLVDRGVRIDPALYRRLAGHRLREPIDQQIGIDGMVDIDTLCRQAQELIVTSTVPRLLAAALGRPGAMLEPLREVALPRPIALKLTLMRDQHPGLLRQALGTVLVSLFLADRLQLPGPQRSALAAAALLRDIGMLHIDPTWLVPHRPMNAAERRHLHAHPLTSMLLIRAQGGYPAEVATAVFEHHERLDGSGYPRGAREAALSPLGKILLLAELVAALGQKFGDASPHRLGLVLRLNRRAFPVALIAQMLSALQGEPMPSARQAEEAARKFVGIAGAFEQWAELQAGLPAAQPAGAACIWLRSRMAGLRQSLTEAGGPPEEPHFLLAHAAGDELHVADALALGREALWQLGSIRSDILQRWPVLVDPSSAGVSACETAVARWCRWTGDMLAGMPSVSPVA
ncbi:phosphohydrolase [Xylophilus sp. Kf1]|nr:phosphohydrolase [Xylophilus sp. Kf1]